MEYVVIQVSRADHLHVHPMDKCAITFMAKSDEILVRVENSATGYRVLPTAGGSVQPFDSLTLALYDANRRRDKESQPTPEVE